jgi:hypothetical protein
MADKACKRGWLQMHPVEKLRTSKLVKKNKGVVKVDFS